MKTISKRPKTSTIVIGIEAAFGIVHRSLRIACKKIVKHADKIPANQSYEWESYYNIDGQSTYNKRITISKSNSWNWMALIRLMYHFGSVFDAIDVSYKSNICLIKRNAKGEKLN